MDDTRGTCYLLVLMLAALPLHAAELWTAQDGEAGVSLDAAVKGSFLRSRSPDDPWLYPERSSRAWYLRSRFGLGLRLDPWASAEFAYEHRLNRQWGSASAAAASSVVPAETDPPFRLAALDWELAEGNHLHRHEIDRALIALHPPWGEIVLGRQAIGLGRGTLFSAVDMFSPFSPAEVDREWRRGVDAARVECRLSDTSSTELILVLGKTWDDSALLLRLRGYLGTIDGEIIAGRRGRDEMAAAIVSSALGDAEVHAELAVYNVPENWPDGTLFGTDHLVPKAVMGSSYTFGVGNGLTLLAEYHYSGFGVDDAGDVPGRLANPAYRERYLRGDTQVLACHTLGFQASYPVNDTWTAALLVLESPSDGSGLISPSVKADLAQNVSFTASAQLPWGTEPELGIFRSHYGAASRSIFLQLSVYY